MEFVSQHGINEKVVFSPMQRHCRKFNIEEGKLNGKIVAVRFTEAKVFYDIIDNYWGKLFDDISSENLF